MNKIPSHLTLSVFDRVYEQGTRVEQQKLVESFLLWFSQEVRADQDVLLSRLQVSSAKGASDTHADALIELGQYVSGKLSRSPHPPGSKEEEKSKLDAIRMVHHLNCLDTVLVDFLGLRTHQAQPHIVNGKPNGLSEDFSREYNASANPMLRPISVGTLALLWCDQDAGPNELMLGLSGGMFSLGIIAGSLYVLSSEQGSVEEKNALHSIRESLSSVVAYVYEKKLDFASDLLSSDYFPNGLGAIFANIEASLIRESLAPVVVSATDSKPAASKYKI